MRTLLYLWFHLSRYLAEEGQEGPLKHVWPTKNYDGGSGVPVGQPELGADALVVPTDQEWVRLEAEGVEAGREGGGYGAEFDFGGSGLR